MPSPSWLPEQYVALCERQELLTDDEAERLGITCFAALSRVRERIAETKEVFQVLESSSSKGKKKGSKYSTYVERTPVPRKSTLEWLREERGLGLVPSVSPLA